MIDNRRKARYRNIGIRLLNYSDGGNGTNAFHTSETTREKLRKSRIGKKQSDETNLKNQK